MAEKNVKVLLGFEDELILDKHQCVVNYTTNKIGGKPDWPTNHDFKSTNCPLCKLPRPLVIQIYAPLDNSPFHRTLYIFACINPNCWNQNESWICIRNQVLDQKCDTEVSSITTKTNTLGVTDWCQDADDWDDNNANINEENGNVINQVEHPSDDEDESCSFEEAIKAGMGNLSVDDRNANIGGDIQGGGAVGRQNSPIATAEIEGDESEVVTIDAPLTPQHDLAALLQEVTPLPQDLYQRAQNDTSIIQFVPSFISVAEDSYGGGHGDNISDHHIRELLQEYQQTSGDSDNFQNVVPGLEGQNDASTLEKYEKSVPAHGDKMFHNFLTKIQNNPGQIIRYQRGGTPLLLYLLQDVPRKCNHCQGDMTFEMQILPTLIPKLRLHGVENKGSRIEFGTVLIFSCSRSCWSADGNFKEEAIIVQCEKY